MVINCSLAYFNEGVMEACLKAGTHYTDMGGLFHWAKKQLAMDDRFAAAASPPFAARAPRRASST